MVNCKISDLKALWDTHWPHMVDDILLNQWKLTGNALLQLNEKQLQYFGLAEIHKLLKSIGKSLKDYNQMPQPPISYLDSRLNNLIIEETSYDVTKMEEKFKDLFANCNKEQLEVYNGVMNSIEKNEGGLFFVYGSGGCGEIVASCITRSRLWKIAKVYKLLHNMRLNKGTTETEIKSLRDFAKWVLDIGDGKIVAATNSNREYAEDDICIPEEFCNLEVLNSVDKMINTTFPNFQGNYKNPDYLSERAILVMLKTCLNTTINKPTLCDYVTLHDLVISITGIEYRSLNVLVLFS
ncbi:hypothetical protein POM88_012327 [Heracleum sosnowskyi]|uniref:ATP-dependent DNA helicase n=1 Tax=Heracleum sosnowskyi TaxID=360622 RepID=A0AAD8N283_9APIA|nr:hypothetical protein POM88_012327 [Heracleum sosnowskyi]